MVKVELGLEKLLASPDSILGDARIGLICNQASVNKTFRHAIDLIFESDDIRLTALFGPQHGIRGDVQDNMIETAHSVDKSTGLKVYSLYSETREPTEEMLEEVDCLVFDLQDIGGRVYTFIYTMANAMKACARFDKRFVVLDRPNPIGGEEVEGNLLEPGNESFVGQFPIPMRHGMTTGELARLFNEEFGIGCDLEVVGLSGWNRNTYLDETDAPWVMPSPNMPTMETAVVFPGSVFLEGTEVSEGRGTTRPFELIGAPYVDSDKFANELNSMALPGVYFRATSFMPTFQKFAGIECGGIFIHVVERREFRPVITGIAIVKKLFEIYGDRFKWKESPYEYEFDRNPFDVIAGTVRLREKIESGCSIPDIESYLRSDEKGFRKTRSKHLMY